MSNTSIPLNPAPSSNNEDLEFEIKVPGNLKALHLVQSNARALAEMSGFNAERINGIELACEEAFSLILARVTDFATARFTIHASLSTLGLMICFDDQEIPPMPIDHDQGPANALSSASLSQNLIRKVADEATWVSMGRQGNRQTLFFKRPIPDIHALTKASELSLYDDTIPLAPPQEYIVRLAGTEGHLNEWHQIARAMFRAYGFTYPSADFYVPERIAQLNHQGHIVSVVAATLSGEVVGHYALDLRGFGQIGITECATAEIGRAVVNPAHRGRGLMEKMRQFTEHHARELGMQAVFSEPTMVHTFSQRANERLGAKACAVNLAMIGLELDIKSIAHVDAQSRGSTMVYTQFLASPPPRQLYAPIQHQAIICETYHHCGIPFTLCTPGQAAPHSELGYMYQQDFDFGSIQVSVVGAEIGDRLKVARDELVRRAGTRVIYLDIRLEDPACQTACQAAEKLGFFYSGIGPYFSKGHDIIRLQYIDTTISTEHTQVTGDFGQRIVDYVLADRRRVDNLR